MDMNLPNVTNGDLYKILKDIKFEIKSIREDFASETNKIKEKNEKLEHELDILKSELEGIRRDLKKNNIILYGLKEDENIDDEVLNIIQNVLKVDCTRTDILNIQRIGKRVSEESRPVRVELFNHQLKHKIFANIKTCVEELKQHKISLSYDYTKEELVKRKVIVQYLKEARKRKHKAIIRGDNLIVNGDEYSYEDLIEPNGELRFMKDLEDNAQNKGKTNNDNLPNQLHTNKSEADRNNKKLEFSKGSSDRINTRQPSRT